jgi:hypothetical protein
MTIKVIEQSTQERELETKQLFQKIEPLLRQGYTYRDSLKKIGRITPNSTPSIMYGWFKELIDYGKRKGYPYNHTRSGRKVKS